MANRLTQSISHRAPEASLNSIGDSATYIHNPAHFGYYLYPFKLIGKAMVLCLLLGFGAAVFATDSEMVIIFLSAIPVLALFYVVGHSYFQRFSRKESSVELELDEKQGLVRYKSLDQDLLFHREQVKICVWQPGLLLPYRVDQVQIFLQGERVVKCSSLLIDPMELLDWLDAPISIEQKWFL